MFPAYFKKLFYIAAAFLALWLGVRYVLPVVFPFLLGGGLALLADPLVRRISTRLPRGAAAGVGVSAALLGVMALLSILGAFAFRELENLAGNLPRFTGTVRQGITLLQDWLISVSEQAPEEIRPALQRSVLNFFDDGTVVLGQVSQRIPSVLTSALSTVGNGALTLGTGLISAFLISARLPQLRASVESRLPNIWKEKTLPALRRVKAALGGWLTAQLKLCAVTFVILTVGFVLLKISYAPVWAGVVALIDAVPILGTGTVLVPWAIVCFLQGQTLQAVGLLSIYATAAICRTVLEPRLVGQHLGLDPLTTLVALYVGLRFWGFWGLLLTPILASAVKSLIPAK